VLICEIKGLKARGHLIPNGFLILKGSEAVGKDRASSEKWPWPKNMRLKLKEDGALLEQADRLVFTKDVEFSSPSTAAAVVHGGHANGLTAWRTDEGKTLKEIESV
jgi:type VI protein secretion system component Hcp